MQIRATNPEDKELRREAILDAAEQLWLSQPERMSNVADIASAAGVAKGTVYLYFRSKEELFLAIHGRHVDTFFNRLKARANQPNQPMALDDLFAVNRAFLLDFPAFLLSCRWRACATACWSGRFHWKPRLPSRSKPTASWRISCWR